MLLASFVLTFVCLCSGLLLGVHHHRRREGNTTSSSSSSARHVTPANITQITSNQTREFPSAQTSRAQASTSDKSLILSGHTMMMREVSKLDTKKLLTTTNWRQQRWRRRLLRNRGRGRGRGRRRYYFDTVVYYEHLLLAALTLFRVGCGGSCVWDRADVDAAAVVDRVWVYATPTPWPRALTTLTTSTRRRLRGRRRKPPAVMTTMTSKKRRYRNRRITMLYCRVMTTCASDGLMRDGDVVCFLLIPLLTVMMGMMRRMMVMMIMM